MPITNLTAAFCRDATCKPGKRRTDWYDRIVNGLILECRQSGGKTYYFRYLDAGSQQRQLKIGGYNDITFDQARKKARELRSNVTLGGNPAAEKATRKAVPTYNELADQHYAHAKTYQKRPEHTERILRCHLRPRWGKMRLNEIKPQAIALWLAELRDSGLAPATCEKVRITLHRSFELSAKWQIPGGETNPVRSVPRPKFNNKKERFLTAEEAERLVAACDRSENTQLGAIVRILLLTGLRKMEALRARWEHVDLDRKTWHIPDGKTGARHIPLSGKTIEILKGLPRWEGCPWLLPNPATLQPYTDIKKAWMTARKAAGLSDVRVHDLRHSYASALAQANISIYQISKLLGHADVSTSSRYAHLNDQAILDAAEAGAAKILGGQA